MLTTNVLNFPGKPLGDNPLQVYVVDVGQGNLIIVKFPDGYPLLVDAGMGLMGSSGVGPTPDEVVATVNTIMGDTPFTTVVITHADGDHYNMIPNITQAANPTYVHIGGKVADYSIEEWFESVAGKVTTYSANYFNHTPNPRFGSQVANVYVLAANVDGDKNAGSIVLMIHYLNVKLILTGDATLGTEAFILENWPANVLGSVMLLMAHHGSNGSSGAAFLSAAEPSTALISAGAYNYNYRQPRSEVITRVIGYVDVDSDPPPNDTDMEMEDESCSIPMHRLDAFTPAENNDPAADDDELPVGDFMCEQLNHAIYSTGSIFNILFQTDGTTYTITADELGAACAGGDEGEDGMETIATDEETTSDTHMPEEGAGA